jgi:7-carboxy-7-deazaguanine synthase
LLKVNEIFYSIQGESTRAGLSCAFIRLAGCNLRCAWCDTQYAYVEGESLSVQTILERIKPYPCRLVEITGGEPLCQTETPALAEALIQNGYTVMVETNGSLPISDLPDPVIRIVDVKCPSSGESESTDWRNLASLRPMDEVKFVIATREDYEWAAGIIDEKEISNRCEILFSPVEKKLASSDLAGWILEDGLPVRLQIQLHKHIWPGDPRGR